MRIYQIKITGDKYPTNYVVEANDWPAAISRAIREWKKRFKGSRTDQLKITALKSGQLLKEVE